MRTKGYETLSTLFISLGGSILALSALGALGLSSNVVSIGGFIAGLLCIGIAMLCLLYDSQQRILDELIKAREARDK